MAENCRSNRRESTLPLGEHANCHCGIRLLRRDRNCLPVFFSRLPRCCWQWTCTRMQCQVQMEHAAIHHVAVNRADGTTLPWPSLSSDLCPRLVVMHQRSTDRYGGLSTSPHPRDWLHPERQRIMCVWRRLLAPNVQHTGRLGPLHVCGCGLSRTEFAAPHCSCDQLACHCTVMLLNHLFSSVW